MRRIHLVAPARPAGKDLTQFGFRGARDYLAFIRRHAPEGWELTGSARVIAPGSDALTGGRFDDDARVADLNAALAAPEVNAIVALNGGSWFTRIVDELDLAPLRGRGRGATARRERRLAVLGFSEMTSLVNLAATAPRGRGVYWLCPNYLAWKVKPRSAARAAFAAFWQFLPELLGLARNGQPVVPPAAHLPRETTLEARLVAGEIGHQPVRMIGGCLSVLTANLVGPVARRVRPDGKWLLLEDINEEVYRIDRHFAALKLAGWWDRLAGVLVGDFHMNREDQTRAVVRLVRHYLRRRPDVPVLTVGEVGHTWPIRPVFLNEPYGLRQRGRRVELVHGRA